MAVLVILLMVGLAAIAVFLACLRGFSRALRHKKVPGVFLSVEGREGRLPESRNKALIDFPHRKMSPSGDPVPKHVCSSTVALVEMAILLGSGSVYRDAPAGSSGPKGAKLGYSAKLGQRHGMGVPRTGVQPLSNS
jgi:hypothetical protein